MESLLALVLLVAVALAGQLIAQSSSSSAESVEGPDHRCRRQTDGTWEQCDPGRCCSKSRYCGDGYAHCSPKHCVNQCPPPPPDVEPATGKIVVVATATENHYFNASSSSSSSSSLSCATSLSSLSLSSLHKYPWAAVTVMADGIELDVDTYNKLDTDNHESTAVAGQLITQSSSAFPPERQDHWCGKLSDGTWGACDRAKGRCCGRWGYCGDGDSYCDWFHCTNYCPSPPTPPPPASGGAGTGTAVVVTAVENHHNDHHHKLRSQKLKSEPNPSGSATDHHHVIIAAAINASSSSSSSSSCATSLSSLPLSALHKYPWAAFAPRNGNATTYCGRCLKVTNLGVGGVRHEVKVRVVREGDNEGLELDVDTFNKLGTDGHKHVAGRLSVEYQFESC
ncbi:unnamed protein product [Linum trigynum]|uniref:Chitin-binding type-1 domain-containing protein n=1 Tax=Linum trigynum TaxID=586398 RepID=A0AAV2GTR8_9ROSI